jgi:glycosyltransferase involved in cell wall biosynthesis
MKVVQVISVIATEYGGPSTGSVELNKRLNSRGIHAVILTSRLNASGPPLSDHDVRRLSQGGARISAYPASFPRRLQNSWRLLRAINREVRDADLVHMHGQYLIPHAAAYVAARRFQVPYGVQPHGGLEPYQRDQSRTQKAIYGLLIGRRILRDAKYLQFASESEASNASDVVRADQVRVAPLGATLASEQPLPTVEDWLGETPRQSVYLFLGRLARKKRPDILIRAWAESQIDRDGSRLVIAGPDDEFTVDQLRELAADLGVADSVHFTGRVDAHERSWLYGRAGVFALPSENENFALTVAEAMLAGCYCVVTPAVAASVHVQRSGGGQVVEGNDDLAAVLGALARDGQRVRAGGELGKRYATKNLTWDALADSISREIATPLDPEATAITSR